VPEAPVYEHGQASTAKHEVWSDLSSRDYNILAEPVTHSGCMES
jgi:hypothetical protein